VRKGDLSDWW